MEFNPKRWNSKTCIHCSTKEEWEDCRRKLDSFGLKWGTGTSYLDSSLINNFDPNKTYFFNEGSWANYTRVRSECNKSYTILEWSNFMEKKKFTKNDLRNFDVIVRRNGNVEIVNKDLNCTITQTGWNSLRETRKDLKEAGIEWEEFDIMRVYRPTIDCHCNMSDEMYKEGDLVYDRDRDDVEEMTLEEVCKQLGKTVKIVPNKEKS